MTRGQVVVSNISIAMNLAPQNVQAFLPSGSIVCNGASLNLGKYSLKQPFPLLDRIEQSHLVRQLCEGIDVGAGGKCAASWG